MTAHSDSICRGCKHRCKCVNGGWCEVRGEYVEHQRIKECKDYERKDNTSTEPQQLSMFEDDMNLVPYTSPKKGIGTVERLNDYEGFTEKFKPYFEKYKIRKI